MKSELAVSRQRGENGKLSISMRRDTNSTLRPSKHNQFKYNRENLFLSEIKTNSDSRKFVVSIRLDGHKENEGERILSQISLNKEDLKELRNQIDNLLDNE